MEQENEKLRSSGKKQRNEEIRVSGLSGFVSYNGIVIR